MLPLKSASKSLGTRLARRAVISLVGLFVLSWAYRPTPFGGASHPERIKWVVEKASSMSIAGRTNINKFCCQVTEYTDPDTLTTVRDLMAGNMAGISLQGALRIDIERFDCRNGLMTSEFKHTLKYKEYPQLVINFLSLERLPLEAPENQVIKGWVEVALAGTSRKFEICYTSSKPGGGELQLLGVRGFCFSDFGLKAPRKMGGLVRVEDQLDVEFKLRLLQIK